MDREIVITHLQIIHTWASFALERDLQFFTPKHLEDITQWVDDTLSLLKEQEPVKPIIGKGCYYCGKCREYLCTIGKFSDVKFCRYCGNPVDWT